VRFANTSDQSDDQQVSVSIASTQPVKQIGKLV